MDFIFQFLSYNYSRYFVNTKQGNGTKNMTYILHRKFGQPKGGRRTLVFRRNHEELHNPDRREEERRTLGERRKSLY